MQSEIRQAGVLGGSLEHPPNIGVRPDLSIARGDQILQVSYRAGGLSCRFNHGAQLRSLAHDQTLAGLLLLKEDPLRTQVGALDTQHIAYALTCQVAEVHDALHSRCCLSVGGLIPPARDQPIPGVLREAFDAGTGIGLNKSAVGLCTASEVSYR